MWDQRNDFMEYARSLTEELSIYFFTTFREPGGGLIRETDWRFSATAVAKDDRSTRRLFHYARISVSVRLAAGNLPRPAPSTSSAIVRYRSPIVPAMRV